MPRTVMINDPTKWLAMWQKNQMYCPWEASATASAEKVENVVRAPMYPVFTNSAASGGIPLRRENSSTKNPIK